MQVINCFLCSVPQMGSRKISFQDMRTLELVMAVILTGDIPIPMNQEGHILKVE